VQVHALTALYARPFVGMGEGAKNLHKSQHTISKPPHSSASPDEGNPSDNNDVICVVRPWLYTASPPLRVPMASPKGVAKKADSVY
jgi:hypothetical protein